MLKTILTELVRTIRGRNPWERGLIATFFDRVAGLFAPLERGFQIFRKVLEARHREIGLGLSVVLAGGALGGSLFTIHWILSTPGPDTHSTVSIPAAAVSGEGEELVREVASLLRQEMYAQVEEKLERLRMLKPADARTYQMEGAALAAKGDFAAARKAFQRGVELNPDGQVHRFNLAEIEFMAGNYAVAEGLFREALAKFPRSGKIPLRLYLCALLQGNEKDANTIFEKVPLIAKSPDEHYILAAKAVHEGDLKRARELAGMARLLFGDEVKDYENTLRRTGFFPEP